MSSRFDAEKAEVESFLPPSTQYVHQNGRHVWIVSKRTQLNIDFKIAIYFDPDEGEPGYCAQLLLPKIENAWQTPHIGHIFSDGVICFGGASMRTRRTLREAYAKSCLWAEGMAIMIQSHLKGLPSAFPFSNNNRDTEVRD